MPHLLESFWCLGFGGGLKWFVCETGRLWRFLFLFLIFFGFSGFRALGLESWFWDSSFRIGSILRDSRAAPRGLQTPDPVNCCKHQPWVFRLENANSRWGPVHPSKREAGSLALLERHDPQYLMVAIVLCVLDFVHSLM